MQEIQIYAVRVGDDYVKTTWKDYGGANCEAARQRNKHPDKRVIIECAVFKAGQSRIVKVWDSHG